MAACAVVVVFGLLSGCAEGAPEIQADSEGANPPPVVEAVQITRILAAIGTDLTDSAEASSVEAATRLGGAALKIRTAEFAIQEAYPDYKVNELGTEFSDLGAVAQSRDWPRSFVVATEPAEAQARFLYQLTQADPRSDYKLVAFARMLAGAVVPRTYPPENGSAVVAPAAEGLAISPYEALAAYARAKEEPRGEDAELFDTKMIEKDEPDRDPVRQAWTATKAAIGQELDKLDGKLVAESVPDESFAIMALATSDMGAVVFGQVRSTIDIKITLPEGGTFSIGGMYKGLGGASKVTESVHLEYLQTVVLGIGPKVANAGPIQVLAVSTAPVVAEVK